MKLAINKIFSKVEFRTTIQRPFTLSLTFLTVLLLLCSCDTAEEEASAVNQIDENSSELLIALGNWRGEMQLPDGNVPFNFEVTTNENNELSVFLLNASERFLINEVSLHDDSVVVHIDVYNALFIGEMSNDKWSGYFRRNEEGAKDIPFVAKQNENHRFSKSPSASNYTLKGKWALELTDQDGKKSEMIGVFEQEDKKITGTLLARTGDYRFFEGELSNDSIFLSTFSGASPYLIKGKLVNENELDATLIMSARSISIQGERNDTIQPEDPNAMTFFDNETKSLSFELLNLEGEIVSLSDEKFKDKVVVITIMGTWCPNCVDEAAFLAPWYEENKGRGVEIVAVSFERKDDFDFAKERLTKFIERFGVTYEVVYGGLAQKDNVYNKLQGIDGVISYPTTLFVDRNGKVSKIHTGFYGPATGEYYNNFIRNFNEEVDRLLSKQ